MTVMRLIVAGGAALALSACASIKDHRGYLVDGPLLDSVQPGIDNQESVEKTLGRPTFVSEFGRKDWYYVSVNSQTLAAARPHTVAELVVRVRFDDKGKVAAVDRAGTERVVRIDPDRKETPTLGRDRSFFEDLFGNIGTVGAPGAGGPGGEGGGGRGPNGS